MPEADMETAPPADAPRPSSTPDGAAAFYKGTPEPADQQTSDAGTQPLLDPSLADFIPEGDDLRQDWQSQGEAMGSWAAQVGLVFERPVPRVGKAGRPSGVGGTGWNARLTPIIKHPNRWVKMRMDSIKMADRTATALKKKQRDGKIIKGHDLGESEWFFTGQRDAVNNCSYLYVLYHVPAEQHAPACEACDAPDTQCNLIQEAGE